MPHHPVVWTLMLGVRLPCSMHACNRDKGLWLRLCSLSLGPSAGSDADTQRMRASLLGQPLTR